MCTRMIRCFSLKYRVLPAQTLTSFDLNIITLPLKYIILYICLTSEADRKELQYLQCHANCSVFQVLICLKNIENLPSKLKFRNTSFSVRKNPLVKHFRKSQSFREDFLFRENRQKVKCCPTSYSRRSKTFEFYHFQSPREERRLKETSSSLAGK